MKYNNLKGSIILVLAAFIWGMAFVAQNAASDLVAPFTFNAIRCAIGVIALYIFWLFANIKEKKPFFPEDKQLKKKFIKADIICGVCLAVSVNFQQYGITVYPKGAAVEARASFITALYIIIVPIMSLFIGKKISPLVWPGVAMALVGVYLLCGASGISGFYFADLLIFCCALAFSVHIMAIDSFLGIAGGVRLSIMQFSVCSLISAVCALIFERDMFSVQNIISAAPQLLFLGLMSSGVAYTLQIFGQKYAEPAVASISMSMESVFGTLGGWVISGNDLSVTEIIGCILVFTAIITAQLPWKGANAS